MSVTSGQDYEKNILRDVVEQMRDPDKTSRNQRSVRRVIFALGHAGLIAAFMLAINEIFHPFAAALLAAASGCAIGFGLFLKLAHKQWTITRNHVNLASVERRLKELDT